MMDQTYSELTSLKSKVVDDVIKCDLKDASGLNDFQQLPSEDNIAIPRVGINRFRLPIVVKNKYGEVCSHDAEAAMYVSLSEKKNGVSMSRLCSILQAEAMEKQVDVDFLKTILARYREELRDETDKEPIEKAFVKLKFNYPLKQKSLKSENWGWQYYPVEFEAIETSERGFEFFISLDYEYSSTCPCSLSMAKQYEREFAEGKTTEGSGIGVPHSQRSKLTAKVKVNPEEEFYIEDLIKLLKMAIPTETQSLVKRLDEQAFAILNGAHPMFVEHATKRVHKSFNANEHLILDWLVQLEHIESLHSHNAAAVIYKGVQGGLRADTIF
ncbi:MAG: GTP cyclohydrolase FolE2 [Bacteriovoracaceae bacterium]